MSEMDDIQRAERIEAYMSGKLLGTGRVRFEEELARDPALREDLDLERLLRDTVKNEDVMRFRDRVREVTEEQEARATGGEDTPVVSIKRSRTWAYLAAAASVALVVTFAWMQWGQEPEYAELAMNVVSTYEFSGTRSGSSAEDRFGKLDEELSSLRRSGHLAAYLARSEELLVSDSLFAARYHDPVRLDRAIVWLRDRKPMDAVTELGKLRDHDRWICETHLVRGLAAAMGSNKRTATIELEQARRAGCLSDEGKELLK